MPNQTFKFRTKKQFKIKNKLQGTCNKGEQIRFKTSMLRSNLCDYSDAYIFDKGTITVESTAAAAAATNNVNRKVIFKKFLPFSKCMSRINTTQCMSRINTTIDVVMPMYNYNDCGDNYVKIFGN